MIVVSGNFDPITDSELTEIKQLHRLHHDDVFVQVNEAGILPQQERMELVERALRPYRHLYLISGYSGQTIDLTKYDAEEKEIRSGQFRKAAKGIHQMIFARGYYFQETAQAMCNLHRYEHSVRVAKTAREIALKQNVDPDTAYQAGMLHDITKAMSREEGEKILQIYRPEWLKYSDKIWHSFTAVIWMKQNMSFYDEAILQSIEHHTLGDGRSKLDQILYIADKIEPGRGYDTSFHMQLACHNLSACVELVQAEGAAYRNQREGVHE